MTPVALNPTMPLVGTPVGTESLPAVESLTRRMRDGDEAAWREFHGAYAPRLRRYLLVLCRGDEHAAAESLQQALLRAVRHLRVCRTEPELWGWLTLLARSAAADHRRTESRRAGFLERWFRHQPPPLPEPDRETSEVLADLLNAELAALPDTDRELLTRKYLDHESVRDLSATLGTTEKAVESRLTRARLKLKSSLLARLRHEDPS